MPLTTALPIPTLPSMVSALAVDEMDTYGAPGAVYAPKRYKLTMTLSDAHETMSTDVATLEAAHEAIEWVREDPRLLGAIVTDMLTNTVVVSWSPKDVA